MKKAIFISSGASSLLIIDKKKEALRGHMPYLRALAVVLELHGEGQAAQPLEDGLDGLLGLGQHGGHGDAGGQAAVLQDVGEWH
jgi:hypothetical protein